MLYDFLHRKITKAEDRLPALQGLAKRQIQLTPDRYAWGLMEKYLWHGVCWYVGYGTSRVEPLVHPRERPRPQIAPSWSPLCLNRGVEFAHYLPSRLVPPTGWQAICGEKCLYYPELGLDPVSDGVLTQLRVRGQLKIFEWVETTYRSEDGEDGFRKAAQSVLDAVNGYTEYVCALKTRQGSQEFKSGILWWDTSSEKGSTRYVSCLFCGFLDEEVYFEECNIGKPGLSAVGIVVMPTLSSATVFERVGWFTSMDVRLFYGVEPVKLKIAECELLRNFDEHIE